jgi:spore coat protein CotH
MDVLQDIILKIGNLYKEVWPFDANGNTRNEKDFLNALVTNEEDNPSVVFIRTFAEEIAAADNENIQNVILRYMDINELMSYVAVDRTIKADDSVFHWYCIERPCSNHNYFWYEENKAGIIHLIPWDLDKAFNVFRNSPITTIADEWGEITADGKPFSYGAYRFE